MITFSGGEAVFTCSASGAEVLSWRVNGLSVLHTNYSFTVIGQFTNIIIPATLENNGTMIQCVAGLHDSALIESENATFFIQGN